MGKRQQYKLHMWQTESRVLWEQEEQDERVGSSSWCCGISILWEGVR
jgi:hypothetical protein